MTVLFIIFGISIAGMFVIPLRKLSLVRGSIPQRQDQQSVVRAFLIQQAAHVERWYQTTAREASLKTTDQMLRSVERGAGKLAGTVKGVRVMVQERFRVIPRESLYWKHIHTWRKTNGNGNGNGNEGSIDGEDNTIKNI